MQKTPTMPPAIFRDGLTLLGYSQVQFARFIDLSPRQVSRMAKGDAPVPAVIALFMAMLMTQRYPGMIPMDQEPVTTTVWLNEDAYKLLREAVGRLEQRSGQHMTSGQVLQQVLKEWLGRDAH